MNLNLKKSLNQVIILGKTKKTFWRKSKQFELQVFYTPIKNKIIIIDIIGLDLDHPGLLIDFGVGDNSDLIFKWVESNEHKIIFERNRF